MQLRLLQLSRADLEPLTRGLEPAGLAGRALPEALPPAFVAARSLAQLKSGKSEFWCAGFCILDAHTEMIVGSCGFKNEPVDGQVEIGYGMSPDARGQGYATAAVAELLAVARSPGTVTSVLAQVNRANRASTRVVQKLHFESRGEKIDHEGELLVQWVYQLGA